jgi:hypothetical protein
VSLFSLSLVAVDVDDDDDDDDDIDFLCFRLKNDVRDAHRLRARPTGEVSLHRRLVSALFRAFNGYPRSLCARPRRPLL